ncbi:MAG: NfeD family protein [Verrucomicrobiota bacterium]
MERVIERARDSGAEALILDMDTPGGYAWYTSELILRPFQNLPFPTYTFVNPNAQSAGSLIAVATDHIYMYPTSTIGSALVVSSRGDLAEDLQEKIEKMMRAAIRNVAIAKGHNPDVAEAFVTRDTELVIDGVRLSEKGEVLNLNAIDATKEYGGRPLLAKGTVKSIEELIEREGLEGEVFQIKPTPMEAFAEWVQLFAAVLIVIGLAGAYMELNSPGFGIPGLISISSFSLFFFGNYMAGNLVGYGTVVIFAIGLVLLILEFLVIPGTFVAGAIGVLMMFGSLGAALIHRVDFQDFQEGAEMAPSLLGLLEGPAFTLAVAIVLTILLLLLLMRFLPSTGPMRGLVLEGEIPGGTSLSATTEDAESSLVGEKGTAETDLRPSGKARFDGRLWDVTTDSEFVEKGASVLVVRAEGSHIVVTKSP